MLYHYTSIQALEGILRGCPSEKGLCFWASRYDCFGADKRHHRHITCYDASYKTRATLHRQLANHYRGILCSCRSGVTLLRRAGVVELGWLLKVFATKNASLSWQSINYINNLYIYILI